VTLARIPHAPTHTHCTGRTTDSRLRADHTTHNHEQAHSIPPTEHTIEGGEAHTQSSTQRLDAACNRHTHKHTRPTAHDTNTPHDHEGRVYPHWEARSYQHAQDPHRHHAGRLSPGQACAHARQSARTRANTHEEVSSRLECHRLREHDERGSEARTPARRKST
jgi:hypothetical protein